MASPAWGDLAGNAVLAAIVVITGLRGRRKQNDKQVEQLDAAIGARLTQVEEVVTGLKVDREHEKMERAIMTANVKHLQKTMDGASKDIHDLKESLPRVQTLVSDMRDLVTKTMNFFERIQGKTLEEKPIPGSGGLVSLKKKGEES